MAGSGIQGASPELEFVHRFAVRAEASRVREFHFDPRSLERISPPFIPIRFRTLPVQLKQGARLEFTLYLGPLPVHWQARIEEVSESGFVDHQEVGPFRSWIHRHEFIPVGVGQCEVRDSIVAIPGTGLRNRLVCRLMWHGLPVLFAWRQRATRRLLEQRGAEGTARSDGTQVGGSGRSHSGQD